MYVGEALGRNQPAGCSASRGLPVDNAGAAIAAFVKPIVETDTLPLSEALGRVLATGVTSRTPVPPFDHSAVDGYGLRNKDAPRPSSSLPISARILAGERSDRPIRREAVRIMTGAPVPPGCDTIVKQEHVVADGIRVTFTDALRTGANIRRRGEDVSEGEQIIRAGTLLDTRHIALLAACGVPGISVRRRVRIAIACFGNELRAPGETLDAGQIFDANGAMAEAFATRPHTQVIENVRMADDSARTVALLQDLADRADLIITSGGMARGEEDHTTRAVECAGGVWQTIPLAMRPGKPARVGKIGDAVLLGLPGNPFAALVALLILGAPTLAALARAHLKPPCWLPAAAGFDLERQPGNTEFFPARMRREGAGLTIDRLGKGASARLKPLVEADGLGRIEAGQGSIAWGEPVSFLPFSMLFA